MTEREFLKVVEKLSPTMKYFTSACTKGNYELTNDIMSQAFINLYNKKDDFIVDKGDFMTSMNTIKSYMFKTIRTIFINEYIKTKRRKKHHREATRLEDNIEYPEYLQVEANTIKYMLLSEVLDEIENLPEKRKKIFKMYYIEGKKYEEISSTLKITIDTCRTQVMRSIHRIQEAFSLDFRGEKEGFCRRGHRLTEDNIHIKGTTRYCAKCLDINHRQYINKRRNNNSYGLSV